MSLAKSLGAIAVVVAAIAQWAVLLDRGWDVAWQWYKFVGYGGGGYSTVGAPTQVVFFVLSTSLAVAGFVLSRHAENRAARLASKGGAISLVVGMIAWSAVLMSPATMFR